LVFLPVLIFSRVNLRVFLKISGQDFGSSKKIVCLRIVL
jgi:hypothetical protein